VRDPVIAIDGPAGSGKSTVARGIATAVDLDVLDTGAMYRAVTLAALERTTDLDDAVALADLAAQIGLELDGGRVRLDGRDVAHEIRGPTVTRAVSQVSAHPAVRRALVERQRSWVAAHHGGVVEGRDIGTVVFPDATVKVFLTARDDVRAARRQRDEAAAARPSDVTDVAAALRHRDESDATLGRALRPEDAAPDALVVDTTGRDAASVIAEIVVVVRSRVGSA
jgi:cytidylate kinase